MKKPLVSFREWLRRKYGFHEWAHREDMDFKDENGVVHWHFMCMKCGFIMDFLDCHTGQYKYCPQCGNRLVR